MFPISHSWPAKLAPVAAQQSVGPGRLRHPMLQKSSGCRTDLPTLVIIHGSSDGPMVTLFSGSNRSNQPGVLSSPHCTAIESATSRKQLGIQGCHVDQQAERSNTGQ